MNEDKQLIIVSQDRKKTPSGFGSVSTWTLASGLSLLSSVCEHFLFASSKYQLKTL